MKTFKLGAVAVMAVTLLAPLAANAATIAQGATRVSNIGGEINGINPTVGTSVESANLAYDDQLTEPTFLPSEWVWQGTDSFPDRVVYQFKFSLLESQLSSASLTGLWGVDNFGTIDLNGTELASANDYTTANFNELMSFGATQISSAVGPFLSGQNVLQFTLRDSQANDGGQSAFRAVVNVSSDVSPVPLPAAGFLLLAGLGGLAAARKRKTV